MLSAFLLQFPIAEAYLVGVSIVFTYKLFHTGHVVPFAEFVTAVAEGTDF